METPKDEARETERKQFTMSPPKKSAVLGDSKAEDEIAELRRQLAAAQERLAMREAADSRKAGPEAEQGAQPAPGR